jgi:long-chain fatty acid transport protein
MSYRSLKSILLACSGAAVLLAASTAANAGGFALREQSAYGQGSSFAGIAAGGASLSSMFWNPATMTQFEGKTAESDLTGIFPKANQSFTASSLSGFGGPFANAPGNSGEAAAVPASYSSIQVNEKLWLGLSVNSPFGLAVQFPTAWAGSTYGQNANVKSVNATPSIAYKINDWISVAAGVQIQWMSVGYNIFTGAPSSMAVLGGSGYGYGYTLGATLTPMAGTTIGIGYRSAINQKINGTLIGAGVPNGSITTTINLPDQLSVGLRQRFLDRWTFLAGFEFANWSRIGSPVVTGAATITLPFQYSNGYFYSAGFEYAALPNLTLRTGIAFEQSPITDAVRTPRLPDNDRMWYSVGATYQAPFKGLSFDVGYSYIDVKNTPLNLGPTTGNPNSGVGSLVYVGSVQSNIHIFSVAARYQWDAPERVTRTALITK